MSTRAMILVQYGDAWASPYHMYYRHCDGDPTGLGQELIEAMKRGLTTEEMIEEVCAEDTKATVSEIEDAFLKYQGDLEWIYVIRNPDCQESRSITVCSVAFRRTASRGLGLPKRLCRRAVRKGSAFPASAH